MDNKKIEKNLKLLKKSGVCNDGMKAITNILEGLGFVSNKDRKKNPEILEDLVSEGIYANEGKRDFHNNLIYVKDGKYVYLCEINANNMLPVYERDLTDENWELVFTIKD